MQKRKMKKQISGISNIFNYFLHGIPVFFHAGSQLKLGTGAIEILLFVVDVEVVVPSR